MLIFILHSNCPAPPTNTPVSERNQCFQPSAFKAWELVALMTTGTGQGPGMSTLTPNGTLIDTSIEILLWVAPVRSGTRKWHVLLRSMGLGVRKSGWLGEHLPLDLT